MNRRQVLISGGLSALALIASSCNYLLINPVELNHLIDKRIEQKKEEEISKLKEHMLGIRENIVTMHTTSNIEAKIYGIGLVSKKANLSGEGLIFENYILTSNHLISFDIDSYRNEYENFFFKTFRRYPDSLEFTPELTTLNGKILESIKKDVKRDMAIFKLPEGYKKPNYRVKLGDSDKLEFYDEVHLLGDPSDMYFVPRPGVITSFPGEEYKDEFITHKGKIMAVVGVSGDSGSPIINKEGEIVGITSSSNVASVAFVPINAYKEEIAKYEETLRRIHNFKLR